MVVSTSVGRRSNLYKRNINRSEVSRAWCPAHVECCVAVGKSAQLRRSLLLKGQLLRNALSEKCLHLSELLISIGQYLNGQTQVHEHELQAAGMLDLPTTPRVRVLETFDLSASNIEHFLAEDIIIPSTPKLSAFAPIPQTKLPTQDAIIASIR